MFLSPITDYHMLACRSAGLPFSIWLLLHIACGIADSATEDVGRFWFALSFATACSSQCICLVRLGLLLCPTRLAGAVGSTWGVFLGVRMVSGPQTLLSPSTCLLGGYPWEVDCGSVAMVTSLLPRRVLLLSCYLYSTYPPVNCCSVLNEAKYHLRQS